MAYRAPNTQKKWIQHALRKHKAGALHRQLGIPTEQKIPMKVLRLAAKAPGKLGYRARLAITLRKMKHK